MAALLKPLLKQMVVGLPWTPLLLFADGEQGAWYDPSDLTTLYQDSAGTTPVTTDGDTVGLMLDKSGNGNHLYQPTGLSKPTYGTDGVRHWLETDTVDDELSSEFIKQWSPPFTVAVGARLFDGGTAGTAHFFGMGDANVNYMAIRVRQDSYAGSGRVSMGWRNFSGTGQSTTGSNQSQLVGLYNKPVAIFGAVNADSTIEIKDTEGNASTSAAGDTFGLSNNQPIRLRQGSAPRHFFGGVIIEAEVDAATRDRLLAHYADKAGA